jgi:hypothetical protein
MKINYNNVRHLALNELVGVMKYLQEQKTDGRIYISELDELAQRINNLREMIVAIAGAHIEGEEEFADVLEAYGEVPYLDDFCDLQY